MIGFLNLNKSSGITSHDCVAKVRRILKIKQVGHGGTLDPAATGVLPIAVGKATRLLSYLPEDKGYIARVRFGVTTTTDDLEGEILHQQPCPDLHFEAITAILGQFIGSIEQIPPAYSAIQVQGKRLYDLARSGQTVEVPVRTVVIHKIETLAWYAGEFPEIELAIACGGGTYIRAIARDIGNMLGVGGTLVALTRTDSCGFNKANSLSIEQVNLSALIPPALALKHLPVVTLSVTEALRWCQGQKIILNQNHPQTSVRVYQEDNFLGIGEVTNSNILITKVNIS